MMPFPGHCQLKETGLTKIPLGGRFPGNETNPWTDFRALNRDDFPLSTGKFLRISPS